MAGREFASEIEDSSTQAVREFVAGASGSDDPTLVGEGDLGGAMACALEGPSLPPGSVVCGCVDDSTAGHVFIFAADVSMKDAAGLARRFREAFTVVDDDPA